MRREWRHPPGRRTPARSATDVPGGGRLRGETGLVGKVLVIWLLIAALVVVVLYDAGTILLARVRVADVATQAAADAAATYRTGRDARQACATAARTVAEQDENLRATRQRWCVVDTATGDVTIRLRTTADTLLAGRLPFTKSMTQIQGTETASPSDF